MIKFFKNKLIRINSIAGVEAVLEDNGQLTYNVCLVELNNEVAQLKESFAGVKSLEELSKIIKGNPVSLTVTGKGVLYKKAFMSSAQKEDLDLHMVLPNVNPSEFIFSAVPMGQDYHFFIIRKLIVQQLLKVFSDNNIYTISLFVGLGVLKSIHSYIAERNFSMAGYMVSLEPTMKFVMDSEGNCANTEVKIGDETIPPNLLTAFSSSLGGLIEPGLSHLFENNRIEFNQKRIYHFLLWTMSSIIAICVFLNMLIFVITNNKYDNLSSQNTKLLNDLSKFQNLKKEYNEKEGYLRRAGWLSNSQNSFYIDQLSLTRPEEIILESLIIAPLNEEMTRKLKKIQFNQGVIRVVGKCVNPILLNPWIQNIRDMGWVKEVNSSKYYFDHKNKTGVFELEIYTK
jgi:hypothetical protein